MPRTRVCSIFLSTEDSGFVRWVTIVYKPHAKGYTNKVFIIYKMKGLPPLGLYCRSGFRFGSNLPFAVRTGGSGKGAARHLDASRRRAALHPLPTFDPAYEWALIKKGLRGGHV